MRVLPGCTGPMVTWARVESLDHAADILCGLRSEWTLALATNAEASEEAEIWAALARGGLGGLLDKVYCFRRIGHKKPSREFFTHVLTDLGLTPQQVVMVGDDFESDVAGATQWGIPAIWLNERTTEDRTGHRHWTIHTLRELPGALAQLEMEAGG